MGKILAVSFNNKKRIKESLAEHRQIMKALRDRYEDALEMAIRNNFKKTRSVVEQI